MTVRSAQGYFLEDRNLNREKRGWRRVSRASPAFSAWTDRGVGRFRIRCESVPCVVDVGSKRVAVASAAAPNDALCGSFTGVISGRQAKVS